MPRAVRIRVLLALSALATSVVIIGAASHQAAATTLPTPWEPVATAEVGTVGFYDNTGTQIFSGSTTSAPIAPYIVGAATPRSGDTSAALEICTPSPAQVPSAWPCVGFPASSYPVSNGPGAIKSVSLTEPTFTGQSDDGSLQSTVLAAFPNASTTSGYLDIYQVRLFTYDTAGERSITYDAADLKVDPIEGTFQIVYGTGVAAMPGSSLQVVTAAGPVQVMDPSGAVLSGVTSTPVAALPVTLPPELTAPDGAIGYTVSGLAAASTVSVTIHLTFHPAAYLLIDASGALYNAGPMAVINGDTVTLTIRDGGIGDDNRAINGVITDPGMPVQAPPTYVATVFTANAGNLTTGQAVTLTATVYFLASSCPTSGTVTYLDLGDPTLTGQPTTQIFQAAASTFQPGAGLFAGTIGCSVTTATSSLAVGMHLIESEWTPAGFTTGFPGGSVLLTVTAPSACTSVGSSCTDPQNTQGTVPPGTLMITTPYTQSAPLNLGSFSLGIDPVTSVLEFSASGSFQNIVVTDTRAGGDGWSVMAQSSDLTDGTGHGNGVIDSQDVGLTGVTGVAGPGFAGAVTITQNPAADPAALPGSALLAAGQQGLGLTPHLIATTPGTGDGTYTLNGTLTLNAPSSTESGSYSGTIVFTVG